MAYTSCAAEVAANIAQKCDTPNVGGYTGRSVYIPRSSVPTITKNASNPRQISAITLASGQKTVAVINETVTPFDGSATTLTTDSGTARYSKTLAIRIPLKGADASRDIVEPLVNSPLGGILINEKKYTGGDGSFEVVGIEQGVKATEMSRNESENDGDWSGTLSTTESKAEYTFFDTDYATTLAKFEALLAQSY